MCKWIVDEEYLPETVPLAGSLAAEVLAGE
jgi:hypothetical protein